MFEFLKKKKPILEVKRNKALSLEEELSIKTSEIENLLFKASDFDGIFEFQKRFNGIISEYQKSLESDKFSCDKGMSLNVKMALAELMLQLELLTEDIKKAVMAFIIKKEINYLTLKLKKEHVDAVSLYYNIRKYIEENKKYLSYKDNGEISYLMANLLFDLIKYEYLSYKQILTIQNHTSIEEQLLKDYTADAIRSSNLDAEKINELLRLAEMYSKKEINSFINSVIIQLINDLNPTKEESKPSYIDYIDVSYRKDIKFLEPQKEITDSSTMIVSKAISKKILEEHSIEDYGLLKISNSSPKAHSDSLSLEQIYKIIRLKYLEFKKKEKILELKLKENGAYSVVFHEMKENSLSFSIQHNSESTWEKFEIKIVNGLIVFYGNESLISKVSSIFLNSKEELFSYLNLYQYYTRKLIGEVNKNNIYFIINRVGVEIFHDTASNSPSNIGSKFSIRKSPITGAISYQIKSLEELDLAQKYGEELFRKIYVKIDELPEWMQEELIYIVGSTNHFYELEKKIETKKCKKI